MSQNPFIEVYLYLLNLNVKCGWHLNMKTYLPFAFTVDIWTKSVNYKRWGQKYELNRKLELLFAQDRNDDTMASIIYTRLQLNFEIDKEEVFWEQRSRVQWLRSEDKNTSFFFRVATTRERKNCILRLQRDDGTEASAEAEIKDLATSYFMNLFTSGGMGDVAHLISGIKPSITDEMNVALNKLYTVDEVFVALSDMGPNKAPGFDGFPAIFFQHYQHIVKTNVFDYCLSILNDGNDIEMANYTDIVLIPKLSNPSSMVDFRLISLCSVIYKIVEKSIANRIQG